MNDIDKAVIDQVTQDLTTSEFIDRALKAAKKIAGNLEDPAKDLRLELVTLNNQISKTMDLALSLEDAGPALRKVNELEAQRKQIAAEIARLEKEYQVQTALQQITRTDLEILIKGLAEDFAEGSPRELKRKLGVMIDRIVLDPVELTFQIGYRLASDGSLSMASPRRSDGWAIYFKTRRKRLP